MISVCGAHGRGGEHAAEPWGLFHHDHIDAQSGGLDGGRRATGSTSDNKYRGL
jgi:hypothetical protein